jgi:hypothetical protein
MFSKNRIKVFKDENKLSIHIPVKKNATMMLLVFLLTIPWILLMFILVKRSMLEHTIWFARAAYLLAIAAWSIPGIMGSAFLTWMFFGRERILLSKEQLLVEKPLVFYNRRNYYENSNISEFRICQELYKAKEKGEWVDRIRTVIQFQTPEKEVTFGRGLSPEEAEFVLFQLSSCKWLKPTQFDNIHWV